MGNKEVGNKEMLSKKAANNPPQAEELPPSLITDIQQIINSLPNKHMNTYELQEAIQKILDGE